MIFYVTFLYAHTDICKHSSITTIKSTAKCFKWLQGYCCTCHERQTKKKAVFFKKNWIFLTNQQTFLGSTLKRCPWPQKKYDFTNGRHLVTADSRHWNAAIPDSRWLAFPNYLSPILLLKCTSFYSKCSYGTRETATRLRAAESGGLNPGRSSGFLIFFKTSRPALGPIQARIRRVQKFSTGEKYLMGRDVVHSPPPNARLRMSGFISPLPLHAIMVWTAIQIRFSLLIPIGRHNSDYLMPLTTDVGDSCSCRF